MNIIKHYLWLGYPAGVFLTIIVSSFVLFGSLGVWTKLTNRGGRVQQQTEIANQLRVKLTKLQAADQSAETQNMQYLLTVLPQRKDLSTLLTQIQTAASNSGAVFVGFRGKVGEVAASESAVMETAGLQLEVSLEVADINQLHQILAELETDLPLVAVKQIKLVKDKVNLTVAGLWLPLTSLPAGSQYPVVDNTAQILALKDKLNTYRPLSVAGQISPVDTDVNPDPFQ